MDAQKNMNKLWLVGGCWEFLYDSGSRDGDVFLSAESVRLYLSELSCKLRQCVGSYLLFILCIFAKSVSLLKVSIE
jgi:hypothetical protein